MTTWICDRCGLEHPDSDVPPQQCILATDSGDEERGDLGPHGQWTTHEELARQPHTISYREHGRGVHSLRREPRFAIGHWSFVVQTPQGNLLWDPPAALDEQAVGMVRALGEVAAIATSHPHMFAAQVSWSHAFGRVPVLVNELDKQWVPRPDPVIRFWTDHAEPLPGLELIHLGGHMRGSCVARTPDGTLLSGDTIAGALTPDWVSFQRNYPRHVPLSAAAVRRIVDGLEPYEFDRLYTLGGDTIDQNAKQIVRAAATRHIRWVSGEFDHLI
ncbi:hydrolase [Nocardia transvalensis]|uniref:hydrolase n=1 Tax=Nocardia transvalensis TaxID=37333 RepID=UPI001894DDBF|nr:hydrolase [Nocardia transvalensis]MBF6331768.1 hydrolase [Nocardia transvalensis]